VLFYFTADGRIDFRELVKDLASVFKTRIELRQIGVRDETKIVGGIGICGRPLCCHSYLADFVPVSIKMAKEQNLSLNPAKISGVCGRLMCCLKNEEETYEELNRRLPGIGDSVTTEEGQKGTVQSVNVLRQLVKVVIDAGDEKEIKEYPVEKLHFRRRHSKKEKMELSKEELQELERLDEEEWQRQEQELMNRAEEAQRQNAKNRQGNRRQTAQQGGEGQKPFVQRTEIERRPGQRSEGGQRQRGGQQRQGGRRQEAEQRQIQRPETKQQTDERSGNRRRHDTPRHQNRNRQNSQNQGNRENSQNGKNRYDNRNRREGRSPEGQRGAGDGQA